MKKSLLLAFAGVTFIVLAATTLYAQTTTGTSFIDKMKASVHAFTLSGNLNSGQTGFESAPVVGKKTGDILTAGEWNRVLELIDQVGSIDVYTGELWKCTCGGGVNIVTTSNLTAGSVCISGGTAASVQYSTWSCVRLQNTDTVTPPVIPPVVPTGFTYGCPTGFIEIGYRHQCIEENLTAYTGGGTKTYNEAKVICTQKGGDLCNVHEWQEACENGVLNVSDFNPDSKAEWIDGDNFEMYRRIVTPGVPSASLMSHLNGVSTIGCNGSATLKTGSSSPSFQHTDIHFRCCANKELTEN